MRISFINNGATIVVVGSGTGPVTSVPTIFKGDKGDPGPKGDTGDIGPKGDKGDPGDSGTPSAHTHLIDDVTGLQTALDGKAATSHTHTYASITGKPSTFAPSAHTHAVTDVTGLQAALDGKASTTHTHTYDSITGKPTTFTPAAHTHAISEVTGLQTAIDGKASTSHTHTIGNVTGLQAELDGKQPVTTFKTINNEVITGTGNITITGGGTSTPPVLLENTLTNPPIGARLGPLYSPSSRPFINHFKNATNWEADGISMNFGQLLAGGYITAGGQLISTAPGASGFWTRFFDRAKAETGLSGRWRLRWEGTATVNIFGVSNLDQSVPNQLEFDFTANGENWATFVVGSINPAGGQIRNFSLVHEDDWVKFDDGQIFRDEYLEELRNYRVLRFDEWVGILRSVGEGGLLLTTWESRALTTDEMFRRHVPYEYMAELCNIVGADMWLCMPTAATLDHFEKAAELIQTLMPAPRHVYIEYSTKTWDFAGTPQAHYMAEQGRIAFGTTANPTSQEFRSWYAMRATQMAQLWLEVWNNSPRLHTVIQTQADWLGSEVDILNALMWQERDGTLGLPPYVAPHTVFEILTVHAQIDGGLAYHNNDALITNWRTTLSQTEAFNHLRDQLLDRRHWVDPNYVNENRNVVNLTSKWQYFIDYITPLGMKLAIYEVGNHLGGVGATQADIEFIQAFSTSPQMGEVYTATFNALKGLDITGPLIFSVDMREPDNNTSHGLQRWVGDHNPAWQAVNTLNQLNDGPADRDTYDFVGTYELVSGDIGTSPITWDDITNKPATFTPAAHTHVIADTAGLQAALDSKQAITSFKTINGLAITGTGNVVTSISFATDAEAIAYSNANPGVTVGSTQVS